MKEKLNEFFNYFFSHKRGLLSLLIGLALLMGLAWSGLVLFNSFKSGGTGKIAMFSLTSSGGKGVLIAKDEKLILKSSQSFSEKKIKQLLVFKPSVEVKIKKVSKLFSLLNTVWAADANAELTNEYEITPTADLSEGRVYSVAIATSSDVIIDHKYSWAFQVESTFQVISSFPGDQASDVPLNTGIEITFNRDQIKSFENNFTIEPAVKGKFEQTYNTSTFIPKGDLKEKTLYKVTVKKGLAREIGNEVTGEDFSFSFETKSKVDEPRRTSIGWSSDYNQLRPGTKSFLAVYANGAVSPEITIYKFAGAADFRSEYFRYANLPMRWSSWNQVKYAPEKAVKDSSFKAEVVKSDWRSLIEAPDGLANGFYVFEMDFNNNKTYTFVQKSPLAFYYSLMNGNSLVWLYDYEKKQPAAGLSLKFYDSSGAAELGKTGADGLLEFTTPEGMRVSNDKTKIKKAPVYFEAEIAGGLPYVIISNDINLQKYDKYWNYLSSDRPIYQLKDKINFWGVAKGRDSDLREKKLTVGLYQNWSGSGDPLVATEVTVSPFDTFSGSLNFSGIDPGAYSLVAKFNGEAVSSVSVQIFSYAKPTYKIEVETEKENYWVGENVIFKVKALFFDGTPVSGLKLKYDLNWRTSSSGVVALNDQGEAAVEYKPEYFFDNSDDPNYYNWTYYPRSLQIDFSPAASEEGEIRGSKSVSVFGPDIHLQTFSDKIKGNNYKFEAKVNKIDLNSSDYIAAPKQGQALTARIVKNYYIKNFIGEIYDPIYKVKNKQYRYDLKTEEVATISGATDADGKWIFEKELPPVEFGWYRIIFSGKDANGRDIRSLTYAGYDYYPGGNISLSLKNSDADKNSAGYKVGDKINFEAFTQGEGELLDKKILFYRYTDKLKKAEVKSDFNLTDVFSDDFVPSVRYTAVAPGPNGFIESGSELVDFDNNERKLNVDIKPDKEKYRPKDNVKIDFNVKDKNKNNVKAALNVASVDEALFNILSYSDQGEILSIYYSPLSSWPVTKSTIFFSNSSGAERGGCFVGGTLIKTVEGNKPIENIRIGDTIVTRNSEIDHNETKAIVQGISSHLVNGYISLNNNLKLTPEHVIYLNGEWQMAAKAKIGDNLLGADGNVVKISSIEIIPGKIMVYNILVGKYHTYFASGIYVHNAEKGGGGDVRTNFIDVPLYKDVITDNNGNASVEFKAPDNITSWRVTVNAYEPEKMLAGSNYKLVPVGLPLFVDVVLNKFYLAGDAPILKLRAFGTELKNNVPFEFSLKSAELGLDKVITSNSSEVEIPTGILKEGKYKITVGVSQAGLKDAVEREVNVVGNYFRRGVSAKTEISNAQAQIKGNPGGFTNIAFVDSGTGKYFDDIIFASFAGDLRLDRYTAAFYGRKLLEKYFGQSPAGDNLDLSAYYKNGLSLFPYGGDDLELTAKLSDLAGDYLSTNLLKGYLNAATRDKKADIKRISIALYGLASLKEPVLDQIEYLKNSDKLDNESRVYLALALAKFGALENARELYNSLATSFKEYRGGYLLEVSNDENHNLSVTAMVGVLASYLSEPAGLEKIWTAIATADSNKVAIELEKMMIINNELGKDNPGKTAFSYKTSNGSGEVDLSQNRNFWLYLSEADLNSLTFSNVFGKPLAISFYEESADQNSLVKNNNLKIQRQYLVDGAVTNEFKEGSLIQVRLSQSIGQKLPDDNYQMIDYLPAGLKPITETYQPYMGGYDSCNSFWHPIKIVDNAVYFNTGKNEKCPTITMSYYARIVNKGEFRAQPALIQSVNQADILNISEEKVIIIK